MQADAPAALAAIERVLHQRIGLDPSTVGSSLVHRAVGRRMKAIGITVEAAYVARLAADPQEVQELVEEVVIPETYFFREPEGLDAVAARITSGASRGTIDSPVTILSAPCSTGEEPYSMAMTLLHGGAAPGTFEIDAMDVSFEAVRRARSAVYRGGSFRGSAIAWRPFFTETPQGFALSDEVKRCVTVHQGNLLSPELRAPRASYDVIFCRNLLIYFDTDAQARVLGTLTSLLAPDGVLVVGAADTFAVRRAGYVPVAGAERAFLFRFRPAEAVDVFTTALAKPRTPSRKKPRVVVQSEAKDLLLRRSKQVPRYARDDKAVVRPPAPPIAAEVARLAGAGRLADAVQLGESAMASSDATAELLAIMGTTYAALQDESRAEACYRRALYLDPAHADALMHLALLLDARGDLASADRLRLRARRELGRGSESRE